MKKLNVSIIIIVTILMLGINSAYATNTSTTKNLTNELSETNGSYSLNPYFNKNTLTYTVIIPEDVTSLEINAEPAVDGAIVRISGNTRLTRQENTVTVRVTAKDGTSRAYTITVLKEPKAVLSNSKRIKGLDGNEKMGKSLGNAIYLSDIEEEVNKKVMSAVTDPNRIKKDDLGNPDVCMVAYYHNLFSSKEECKAVCEECKAGKRGCVACKKELAQNINNFLNPIREKRKYYEERPELVDKYLIEGTRKAQETAKETMRKVKKAMKLDYFEDNK